uniref:NADH-ubiquinone oxidoreductase chain 3 n=1 Tax=Cladiucha punctata TaxID=2669317 RepID=A0A8F4TDM5_9HYME|nr:NADH dehydrogenase subunit 3 [Cladiucha punctata]YP_010363330.1 NADH dehydrogenase subunit 3 [Cladiucha huangbki]QXG15719.1 NADH dehydrogenase subunit 3 [Cladiucha punctata]UJM44059.1 NADH dehydrogenase subunit 3 [Cladiucha huangbki]
MFLIFSMMMILWMISNFIMFLASIISKKSFFDREKNSPFECGFDPKSKSRLPFSMRFFLISVIFLIFDVEIALMLPMTFIINISNILPWLFISIYFLIILLMGLYYEWNFGALNWLK